MNVNRLTVCVPVHNGARTVAATLRSILAEDGDFEVTVFDNASTDATADIVRSLDDSRIRLHSTLELVPMGQSWNRTVGSSTRDLVRVVCADDLINPGSNSLLAGYFADTSVCLASSRYSVVDVNGTVLATDCGLVGLVGRHSGSDVARAIVRRGPVDFGPTGASVFRREHFDRVGGFRGDYVWPMDVDLFIRAVRFGEHVGIASTEASWRMSDFNVTATSSTLSKLRELALFHHRCRSEDPGSVRWRDVLAGDCGLAKTALKRLGARIGIPVPLHPAVRANISAGA
jgi:hypothetical protein